MLAIAGCVWTITEAGERWCMPAAHTDTEPWIIVSGVFAEDAYPCEPEQPCQTCLTIVLKTSDKTYYLTAGSSEVDEQLDAAKLGPRVTVEGKPFTRGSYDYIEVNSIDYGSLRLPSLCDEWHVLRYSGATLPWDEYDFSTYVEKLTTDTIIHGNRYVKLMSGGGYRGALREGDNHDIYFIPAHGDHEFLLYAFNAQAGDTLTNLWLGGTAEMVPQNGYKAVITAISDDSPRIFNIKYIPASEEGERLVPPQVIWREGIGLDDGPVSVECPTCACSCGHIMLCAYKDGKQVYASEEAEKYGCYYDSAKQPADTVALYWRSGDGPGSTTVTPVDPNQVVATLNDNLLTIREQSGEEVTYSLAVTPINHAPARHELPEAQKEVSAGNFRNSVAVQLSQNGSYTLTLSKAGWENDIYGSFDYTASGLQPVATTDAPARKILRNGQLLIQQGDKIFTLTGVQVE